MGRLLQFFEDDSGKLSSSRLAFLAWVITTLVVWAYLSVQNGKMQTVDWSVVGIIGSLMAGKVVQSFSPSDSTKNTQ